MKKLFISISAVLFTIVSFSTQAAYISAWGDTISSAEKTIEEKANGKPYEITSVRMGDYAYITANISNK